MAWYWPPFRAFPVGSGCGVFTPLVIFAVFFLAQLILPGKRVPGYVINPETGEPRNYRLNGILVFAIALIVWTFELTGLPRDWFYRSTIYSVAGGTVFSTIFTVIAVYSQPQGRIKNPLLALWAMAAYPDPGFSPAWSKFWLIGTPALFLVGWGELAQRQYAEIHIQAMAGAQVSGSHRA